MENTANQFSPYNFEDIKNQHEINKEKAQLRGRCISTGLLCSICIFVFFLTAIILTSIFESTINNTPFFTDEKYSLIPDMLLNGFVSLLSFGLVGVIFCKITKTDYSEIFPHRKTSFKRIIAVTAIGFTICICANYIAQLFLIDLSIFGVEPMYDPSNTGSTTFAEHIAYIVAVSFVPAVSEEFIFRGCVMGRLRKFGDGFALITSAALFGLMHGNFAQATFAFVVGLAAGWAVIYSGSIIPAMLIHLFNNFMSVMGDIIFEKFESSTMGTNIVNIVFLSIYTIAFLFALYAAYKLSKKDKSFTILTPYEGKLTFKERIGVFASTFTIIIFSILTIGECLLTLQVIE